ncbi:MAG: hypothetical protein EOP22_00170 [Hyphomicrobiales bacterium]|nr:MAG: hypothetical protein EOP22_00170 [Hyphomicrobiales bacterium]
MSSVIHIAEVATLLAVAYIAGWAVGYLAHRVTARRPAVTTIPAERLAAVTGEPADALVKAPVIVPVASDPPSAPVAAVAPAVAEVPPDPETTPTAPAVTDALPPVTIPVIAPPADLFVAMASTPIAAEAAAIIVEPPSAADLAPEPAIVVEQPSSLPPEEPVFAATPALRPGVAWSGRIKGRDATPFTPLAPVVAAAEPPPVAPVAPVAPRIVEDDEDAAMRAIEGGWSRTRARAMPDAPELHDVGVAVAAATAAVEQVLSQTTGATPAAGGKPLGLVRPRLGGKDDLKQITGLGGLDESTLNNLGVFHFDQIAAWSEAEVLWMENHVFARGRIGHENWQAQARQLAAAVDG